MGTSLSKSMDLSMNEYLIKFVGKEYISPNDPFWNRFLAFNVSPPKTSDDQLALDSRIEPLCQQLLTNNLQSGNLGALIQVFLTRASELLAATNTDDNMFSWQTFNALFIIRCLLKYLSEMVNEEQLFEHVELGSDNSTSRVESFIGALLGISVDVPLQNFTYAVHLESVTCLLVLLSVQMHSSRRADQSNIYRVIIKGRHAIHAPLLMKSLLQNFIEQKRMPDVYGSNSSHSFVFSFAAGLWSLVTFGRTSFESLDTVNNNNIQDCPLAAQSLLLILVLTNHCTAQVNPYRQSLFTCTNSEDNTPMAPTKSTSLFKIDYGVLFTVLCKQAETDTATLLLYLLLHRNITFRNYILSRYDIDQLIIPILKTLYHAPSSNSHHIYMSLIILLILSEDDSFNKNIHETKLKTVPWYTERTISEISLGGVLILVVIRTIQYNMFKMRDKYLHTNCLAALANMSAHFWDLHPYVSQRLISLFETLAKRYLKYQKSGESVTVVLETSDQEQDLTVVEEVLRMVLEILNSCLSHQLSNNPNLVHTLLYKKHAFEPFKDNQTFQDVVHNIDIVIEYFSEQLSVKAQHEVDFHEVLSIIQQGAKNWPREKLTKFPDLKFKYVEEEQPEDFFIPYVWSLVNHHSILNWSSDSSPAILNPVC